MTEEKQLEGTAALLKFKEETIRINTEREIATEEWLLGNLENTIAIPIRGKKVKIRLRISAEEQQNFQTIYEIFSKSEEGYNPTDEEEEAVKKEILEFISTLLVDPEVKPEDVNKAFTGAEKTRIIKHFFFGLYQDAADEAIAFFRQDGTGADNAQDMGKDGPKPSTAGKT
jgi:hypothetical protein